MALKTHCPSTKCPRWYLRLPTLLSSICTRMPFLPSGSLLRAMLSSQIARQNIDQSTIVLELIRNRVFTWLSQRSAHHQYVIFIISCSVKLLIVFGIILSCTSMFMLECNEPFQYASNSQGIIISSRTIVIILF